MCNFSIISASKKLEEDYKEFFSPHFLPSPLCCAGIEPAHSVGHVLQYRVTCLACFSIIFAWLETSSRSPGVFWNHINSQSCEVCRDGSVVIGTECSRRGPGLDLLHPHRGSQPQVIWLFLLMSPAPACTWCTDKTFMHIGKNKECDVWLQPLWLCRAHAAVGAVLVKDILAHNMPCSQSWIFVFCFLSFFFI